MNLYDKKIIFGEFHSDQYGLSLATFSNASSDEEDLGFGINITTDKVGNSAISHFIDYSYSDNLEFNITFVKDDGNYLSDKEIRRIFKDLSGLETKYHWLQHLNEESGELYYYKAVLKNRKLYRIAGNIAGIVLEVECDSPYAYTKEFIRNCTISSSADSFTFYCSTDESNIQLSVEASITVASATPSLEITNTVTGVTSKLTNLLANETVILNSQNDTISSSIENRNIINEFNLNWIKLKDGKNTFTFSAPCQIEFKYRELRKVGA